MERILNVQFERNRIYKQKEELRDEVLRMEGIIKYYDNLIKNDLLEIKVPMSESEKEEYQKLLEDDDI
jgi:hypothetical protein